MSSELICPYPGLRPFTEDESIFFKGREDNIDKIIKQLEEKKFLMLTGASGDGKSSLIYAGVIPNARAGFFKAKFNNWIVADFRPERNPLKNLSKSLSEQLKINDVSAVENELKYGYSSLVKLYKSTSAHLDTQGEEWLNADETTRKKIKRKASNLLILADQFEEFFTNNENFLNGIPSIEAQTTVNLLLETAKIAQEQDLPIYIVCTMRSDYIGQCAVFRDLPEFIGFSQFFVPRLKRKELLQVIEEPAVLSGNKITKRLSETLINELNEGIDQLPVLQHALHQIWKMSVQDGKEMDIIHLAMLGGVSPEILPASDKSRFDEWFKTIPSHQVLFFKNPSLGNVLNAHADELFESAASYYQKKYGEEITKEDAKNIIETVFKCLTKIDEGRAVRNRMTLTEINSIVNKKNINEQKVGRLLTIFREEGNTFINPYITGGSQIQELKPESILDITHESLIRNWNRLKEWTSEEDENLGTFQDFSKQMQLWIKNNKSKEYLLSIGPLSFFELWYNNIHLSKYWILKYDNRTVAAQTKITDAENTLNNVKEYLSGSKKAITRKKRISAILTVSVLVLLSGFTVWAFLEREKALKEQIISQQLTIEANKAKEKAIQSESLALKAKQEAEESEKMAIASKDTANKAKELAMIAQREALLQKDKAQAEATNAAKQTIIAETEARKAEQQRQISDREKQKAEASETKARQLTLISLAQNIALKSVLMNDNAQLKALLAMQAYIFTKNNNGQTQDPVIYEALKDAAASLGQNRFNAISGYTDEIRSVIFNATTQTVIGAGKDGVVTNSQINNSKYETIAKLKTGSPMCYLSLSPRARFAIAGHDNNGLTFWNLTETKPSAVSFGIHKGPLRSVAFINNQFATAGKDNEIAVWNNNSNQPELVKRIPVDQFVKSIVYSNASTLIVASENGNIYSLNIETNETKTIFQSTAQPLSMSMYNKNKLIVGFADGKIRIFDLSSSSGKFVQLSDNQVGVEVIALNNTQNLMAVAVADKSIKIYDLNHLDRKPVVIKDHKSKARSLVFDSENKIIAGCENKSVRMWETSSDKIADQMCSLLKRNMTEKEWKQYVGNQFSYSKTCSNLP